MADEAKHSTYSALCESSMFRDFREAFRGKGMTIVAAADSPAVVSSIIPTSKQPVGISKRNGQPKSKTS